MLENFTTYELIQTLYKMHDIPRRYMIARLNGYIYLVENGELVDVSEYYDDVTKAVINEFGYGYHSPMDIADTIIYELKCRPKPRYEYAFIALMLGWLFSVLVLIAR